MSRGAGSAEPKHEPSDGCAARTHPQGRGRGGRSGAQESLRRREWRPGTHVRWRKKDSCRRGASQHREAVGDRSGRSGGGGGFRRRDRAASRQLMPITMSGRPYGWRLRRRRTLLRAGTGGLQRRCRNASSSSSSYPSRRRR